MSVNKYLNNIAEIYKKDDYLEHTFRTDFENMLNEFIKAHYLIGIEIIHEPPRGKGFGAPDFKITDNSGAVVGYIECKNITEDIKNLLDSEQIKKYLQVSNNLILTNYIDFIYFLNGEVVADFSIASRLVLSNKRVNVENEEKFKETLNRFFLVSPEQIKSTKELSFALASRTKILHDLVLESMEEVENDESKTVGNHFYAVYENAFKPVDEQLSIKDFSDMYAQILSFGFLFYKLSYKNKIDIGSVAFNMPNYVHIPLLSDVFNHSSFNKLDITTKWIIDEIIVLLNNVDVDSINKILSYKDKSILSLRSENMEDPFLFFYEEFLSIYNKELKVDRGVFYTPEAIVSFIIRSIDDLLIKSLDTEKGFLDQNIKVLDFATGTGTFILALIEQIYNKLLSSNNKGLFQKEVSDFILKNIFGFEFLAVPYIICHLRIQEYLESFDFKYKEKDKERAQVYLTNTLDHKVATEHSSGMFEAVAYEMKEANRIKSKEDILVVMGNPPYNVSSKNKTEFIEELMKLYKEDVKSEKNIQPLSDDYIKFIRFAHHKIESNKKGIVGIITNNSYLDGVIHRGMRKKLVSSFDEIYILNLRGNSNIGDKCEDGTKDENVFDIKQGVAISFFVKTGKAKAGETCKVYYKNLQGLRKDKYKYLYDSSFEGVDWQKLTIEEPYYWFVKKDFSHSAEYEKGFKIDDIFETISGGIKTHRDDFTVAFNKDTLKTRFNNFMKYNKSDIESKLEINDTRDWKIEEAKHKLEKVDIEENIMDYSYRPFDTRKIMYNIDFFDRGTHRYSIMKHFIDKDNIGLILRRTAENTTTWQQVFVSNLMPDINLLSAQTYMFPLYTYNDEGYQNEGFAKKTNFTEKFNKYLKDIGLDNETPEDIFDFIYASLHSPNYRKKYYEFLKIDFPRVNFEVDKEQFAKLVKLGRELIDLHTLKTNFKNSTVNFPCENADYKVSKVKREGLRVYINDTTYFDNVSDQVYNFYIGGYQVVDKWIKERKKHFITLSLNDINHFIKICDVIETTINIMDSLDK